MSCLPALLHLLVQVTHASQFRLTGGFERPWSLINHSTTAEVMERISVVKCHLI